MFEHTGIKDEDDIQREEEVRKYVKSLPPPPKHPHSRNYKARNSDVAKLDGRKGMRSPELGLSASACNSPNAASDDEVFSSAQNSKRPSGEYARIPQYHDAGMLAALVVNGNGQVSMDASKNVPDMSMLSIEAKESADVSQPLDTKMDAQDSLKPPPLQHQDSEVSVYSEASDTAILPEYEEGSQPVTVVEKPQVENSPNQQ